MMVKSQSGALPCGEDIVTTIARFEHTGQISQSVINDVKTELSGNN